MSVAMRDAFGAKLAELGNQVTSLVVLDADVSSSTKSALFAKAFPERFFNCGVAEANMVDVAAGLATAGFHPVVNTFSIFLALKATDQIRNVVCYNKLPVVLAGAYGGLSDSFDGASHQSVTDIAIMRAMPTMEVIVPADAKQAQLALAYALEQHCPVYIRINRNAVPDLSAETDFSLKQVIVLKEGKDVTIATTGSMASQAMKAAKLLAEDDINAQVLSIPFVKPLDVHGLVSSATKTKRVVTVEEHSIIGGFGSACAEALTKAGFCGDFSMIGIEDRFTETGAYDELLAAYGLNEYAIAQRVRLICKK